MLMFSLHSCAKQSSEFCFSASDKILRSVFISVYECIFVVSKASVEVAQLVAGTLFMSKTVVRTYSKVFNTKLVMGGHLESTKLPFYTMVNEIRRKYFNHEEIRQ